MKRRHALRRRVVIVLTAVFLAACLLIVTSIIAYRVTKPEPEYTYTPLEEKEAFVNADFERKGKWFGLCTKNSIHSVEDFFRTVSSDPVLKIHYADFRWEKAKIERLDQAILAYVYYRKDDKIFLTKKPIRLPDGDEYITDGYTRVRTFCCNNYTVVPRFGEAPGLLAELSTGPSPFEPPALLVDPSVVAPVGQSAGQMAPVSPNAMQLAMSSPPEENLLRWQEESPFIATISKEFGYGETTIGAQPEETSFFTSVPQEYGYGGATGATMQFPQSSPTPTSIIPGDGDGNNKNNGGGSDGEDGGPKPIPEAATILLVGVGVAVSFLVFFVGNYHARKGKTPGRGA